MHHHSQFLYMVNAECAFRNDLDTTPTTYHYTDPVDPTQYQVNYPRSLL